MQTIQLKNWEEFQKKLEFPSLVEKIRRAVEENKLLNISFRGQANAGWELETTLQRIDNRMSFDSSFISYLRRAIGICGAIDTHTDSNWDFDVSDISNLEINQVFEKLLDKVPIDTYKTRKKIIEYLIYLRHCGFPSPLLDWSDSPYVAAFFAFNEDHKDASKVAIYQYRHLEQVKGNRPESEIHFIPYDLKTHKRHYLQQTRYTICVKNGRDIQGFWKYDEAISSIGKNNPSSVSNQDLLIKYEIPSLERRKVLRQLDTMNINAFSLFGTEEALVETLALREMELWKD